MMMEKFDSPSEEILKQAITEIKKPVLFQRLLQDATGAFSWKLLEWNLLELAEKFGDIKLPFRVGYNAKSVCPQWEVNCSTISMTLSEFIQNINTNENDNKWYYFDYKYMHEWFKDKPEIINSLNWERFGFKKMGSDSTLWIGSKGAHTNCHQDSYGCNLVAQIHGRKQWLLFSPSSNNFLRPTRIPYEESTVYSKYNFFCPTEEDEISIMKIQDKPKLVTLEPGDVLLVPSGWWHYVESLDFSISVNIWLPIITDSVSRVKEAVVKLIVGRIGKDVCKTSKEEHTLSYCLKLLSAALEEYKNMEKIEPPCKKMRHSTWTSENLAAQYPIYVKLLHELTSTELEEFLKKKRERFPGNSTELLKSNSIETDTNVQTTLHLNQHLIEDIINALCHPDVINKATDLLLSS